MAIQYDQPGSGLASLSAADQTPEALLAYFNGTNAGNAGMFGGSLGQVSNFDALASYLEGTYFSKGQPIPGTSIYNQGDLLAAVGSTPGPNGVLQFAPGAASRFAQSVPGAETILSQARDWGIREQARGNLGGVLQNNLGGLAAGLPIYAALGGLAYAGNVAGGVSTGATTAGFSPSSIASGASSGLGATTAPAASAVGSGLNPNAVPGISTGVTTPSGGGLVGSGTLNPAGIGIQGGASLGASPLAAAGTAGVAPLPGVADLTPYFDQFLPGTNQFLGGPATTVSNTGTSALSKLKDLASAGGKVKDALDLLTALSTGAGAAQTDLAGFALEPTLVSSAAPATGGSTLDQQLSDYFTPMAPGGVYGQDLRMSAYRGQLPQLAQA